VTPSGHGLAHHDIGVAMATVILVDEFIKRVVSLVVIRD
jgi:hypothetical protein